MSPRDAVRAAIPGASDDLVEFVIWGRTPYPFDTVTARDFYKAANRWGRAYASGRQLCEFCDRLSEEDDLLCSACRRRLQAAQREET